MRQRLVSHSAIVIVTAAYVAAVVLITLVSPPGPMVKGDFGINLVPVVASIRCFTPDPGQPSTTSFCVRIITGNIAMFVPLGFILPLMSARFASFRAVLLASLATSVTIEILQFVERFFGRTRFADIDDVILNVTGAVIGYAIFLIVRRPPGISSR